MSMFIKKKKKKSKSHDIIHQNGDLTTWVILARRLASAMGKTHLEDREIEMGCKYCENILI